MHTPSIPCGRRCPRTRVIDRFASQNPEPSPQRPVGKDYNQNQRRAPRRARPSSACTHAMTDVLHSVRERRLLRLTLNRPEKRNALNAALCQALVTALDGAARDPSVGAILLTAD